MAEAGRCAIILQPTKELVDRTAQELKEQPSHPPVMVFHSGTIAHGSVANALMDYLRDPPSGGQILLITHALLPLVRVWPNKDQLDILVDEELQVLRHQVYNVPRTHHLLTDQLVIESVNATYGRVSAADPRELDELARNRQGDEVLELFSKTLRTIVNPHWETFVNLEQYERVKAGQARQLAFHAVLQPSVLEGFRSVFMAAANLQDAAIFTLWGGRGVTFEEDLDFGQRLRSTAHTNGDLLTIYFASQRAWSRRRRLAATGPNGETTLDLMIKATEQLFGFEPFVWQANKECQDNPFGPNAVRLPHKPHGLNSFLHVDNVAFVSSLNPPPDHFRFLETQGLTGDEVTMAIYFQGAYQAVMRTSTRDPSSTTPKRILVPDLPLAEYLHGLFPGSRLEHLEIGLGEEIKKQVGRPRKHASGKERTAASRERAREEQLKMLNDLFSLRAQDAAEKESCRQKDTDRDFCNVNTIYLYRGFVTNLTSGTVYPAKQASTPLGYLKHLPDEEFFWLLKAMHQRVITTKEDNFLISPAVFDPDRVSGTKRGKDNIVYLRHMWLDFENGDLPPEEVPALFPYLRMVVVNSFHHTRREPRFRVIIPTTQQMTPKVYRLLYEAVRAKLEDAGYRVEKTKKDKTRTFPPRRSGLDWGKSAPTSLFYAPSQAQDPEESFFWMFITPERITLDPYTWVEHSAYLINPDTSNLDPPPPLSTKVDQARVNAAVDRWRMSTAYPGEGNDRFFRFALDLRSTGMSLFEIESMLRMEAAYGRSSDERRAQIPSIMSSLRQRS
jgi:hypothetical protein